MNEYNSITITPVANGWIVQLPKSEMTEDELFQRSIAAGVKMAKEIGEDPMLRPREQDATQAEETDMVLLKKEAGIHIFFSFADVLGFLKYKIGE